MKTTALLVLIVSVLGPGSFFGSKKGRLMDPWQWARADEGQQRQAPPERQPRKETPNVPSMRRPPEGQMVEGPESAEKDWQRLERSGNQVARKWQRAKEEQLAELAEQIQEQSQEELQLIRAIAEQEQATETVKAIDRLVAMRSERYQSVIEKAKQERGGRQTKGRERLSKEERRRAWEEKRRSRQSSRRKSDEEDMD